MTLDLDYTWMEHGACNGLDPDLFFPERGGDTTEAKAVCWGLCPVREQCLEWALANSERWGTWGGYSERERRPMRVRRRLQQRRVA